MKPCLIETPYIELQQLLKWAGLCETGGEARQLITAGAITLNGQVETRRSKKVYPKDIVGYGKIELLVSSAKPSKRKGF